MFLFCCGEAHPVKPGEEVRCPRCGKVLRFPRKVETLGAYEREREERYLNDTTPTPTSLKG